jgi:signal transduction histidine kinase
LLLARADHDRDQLERRFAAVKVSPLLDTVATRYRVTTLTITCPPKLVVRANNDDLHRLLGNLLDNAVRHARGPITITARDGDPDVVIKIRDHGPGFDPDFLPHAFERFTRADTARTTGGTGLGLAITATLTTRNQGQITAANHPDGGAVMTVTLPRESGR